jgi:hypothetical protein
MASIPARRRLQKAYVMQKGVKIKGSVLIMKRYAVPIYVEFEDDGDEDAVLAKAQEICDSVESNLELSSVNDCIYTVYRGWVEEL